MGTAVGLVVLGVVHSAHQGLQIASLQLSLGGWATTGGQGGEQQQQHPTARSTRTIHSETINQPTNQSTNQSINQQQRQQSHANIRTAKQPLPGALMITLSGAKESEGTYQ